MADGKIISFVGRPGGTSTYQIKRSTTYANSVAGDVSTKFGDLPDFFNDFGCDRSGVTDDTTKANNALASLVASGKSKIIKIPGNCMLSVNYLSIPSGITIVGEGRFSVLNFVGSPSTTTGRIDANGVSDWALDNFFIAGNKTSPTGVDYANITSPTASTLVGGGNGLPTGSSIWVRGGGGNITLSRLWFNNSDGYSALLDATSGNISRVRISKCRFSNCKPHLFGTTGVGLGLAYGAWTGGIHYEGDGSSYNVSDLLVEWSEFYQMAGHCFWGHSASLSKLHQDISFCNNYAIDHALDMCEIGVTDGFRVTGNKSRRGGYYSATDDAVGVPRWGAIAPAAIDNTGVCINGVISHNVIDCFLGTAIDGDGLGNSVVTNNKITSPWASEDPNKQLASITPAGFTTGTNICKGYNQNNSNDDPRASINVIVANNQIDGCGENAIAAYTLHDSQITGNHGNHPTYKGSTSAFPGASAPIQYGPATGSNRYCRRLTITGNRFSWNPVVNAPIVAEDSQYAAFAATDVNYVYDNDSPSPLTFPLLKDGVSNTTTGASRISTLTPSTGGLEHPGVAEYVLQTEHTAVGATDIALKVYKHLGTGSWAGSYAWKRGQAIIDSGGHLQVVTTAGTSGGSTPTFNHAGSTTTDGSVVWTDKGIPASNLVAYFTETTAGLPSLTVAGNGAVDTVRNFTGNSLTLYGASLSNQTSPTLAIDASGNFFGRSLVMNNDAGRLAGASWGRITNSTAGVTAQGSVPTMSGSINWQEAGGGYVTGLENTSNTAGANGLLVRVRDTGSGTRILTLNAAGTDQLYATGDGVWSAKAYLVGSGVLADASQNVFGRSLTLGSPGSSYDLLTNSATSAFDGQGSPVGTTHGFGITWRGAATGYMMGLENTNNVANSNGLLVRVREASATTRVLDLNVNGTDVFVVRGDGAISGNFSFLNLVLGSPTSVVTVPLVAKSPGAFDGTNDYSPTVALLNCASVAAMDILHLDPSLRGSFNLKREAGMEICVIAPQVAANNHVWEVDGLTCRVVNYMSPVSYSGGIAGACVAGSFGAFAQATGALTWAQNWLVRDWAGTPSSNYAAPVAGLELDMDLANTGTTAAGLGINVSWHGSITPKSVAIQVQHVGSAYFNRAFATQDASCLAAFRVGGSVGSPAFVSQYVEFGPYNDVNVTYPAWARFYATSGGSVIFEPGLPIGNTNQFVISSSGGCGATDYTVGGYGPVVASPGDGYLRSLTQKPYPWQFLHFYFTGECVLDIYGNVQIALNTRSSSSSVPSWSSTVGAITTEFSTGLQWRCLGAPKLVVKQDGNGQLNSLDINPPNYSGASPFDTALAIRGTQVLDVSRNLSVSLCIVQASVIMNGADVIKNVGGQNEILNIHTITCSSSVTCAGVNAGTGGISTGGLTLFDGTSGWLGLGNSTHRCIISLTSGSFVLSFPEGVPPGNIPGGTYSALTVRGGVLTIG